MRSLALGLLIISFLFILISLFFFRELITRAVILGGNAIVISLVILWMIRRSLLRQAGVMFVAFLWLMISFAAYRTGGLIAPIMFGYMAVILIGALVLGNASGFVLAALSVGFGGYLTYADASQSLPEATQYSAAARLFIYAFFFFLILLLQKAAVDTTRNAILWAQSSETQYRSFLENISTVTYINDVSPQTLTTYVSPQVKNVLGYASEEFLANQTLWMELIYSEDREAVLAENVRTSETGDPFVMEYRMQAKDGGVVWVRDEAALIRDENGDPRYWLGIWTDVTERKKSEKLQSDAVAALTKRTNQLQTASEISGAASSMLDLNELLAMVVELIRSHFEYYYVGIFLADENHETLTLQAATGEMGRQMLLSQHSLPVGNSSMVGWCVANDEARIALDVGKDAVRFKNPILPLTRSELALPLRARGQVIGAMTIQSAREAAFTDADITALQNMTDQVANAIETARLFKERSQLIKELETKNAELERFTYTVSHDLKSPLVTIRGFLGYLRQDAQKGDLAHFDQDLARVIQATETMQNLLNDLLELSRIGQIINSLENVAFADIVQEALNLVMNPDHFQKIRVEVHESLPIIQCDRTRIVEVVQNLVGNSMKFMGNQLNPLIQIGLVDIEVQPGFSTFFIKDNGIGIEPQFRERVFGLFNRLGNDQDGTGIGLTLVKRIVEVHGGRIWLESEGRNKGTTFYFTLANAQSSKA
ncbi:MAG: PAS domain-containing protein [Chloroflexi bacterium]|nr:PAS domain-containing protein [Chloroflexota bacterium]